MGENFSQLQAILQRVSEAFSSTREAIMLAGLAIVGAVLIAYTVYGAYKFGVFALRLKPHHFALVMAALGISLIVVSALIP